MSTEPPTADELAWEADRLTLDALPAETRQLVERIADHVAQEWPVDDQPDVALEAAEWAELLDLRVRDAAVDAVFGSVDTEKLDAAIRARLEAERAEGAKDATIPSRANTAQRKAMRLLLEGRLEIVRREIQGPLAGLIHARCKGDSGDVHDLGYDPRNGGRWKCTCPELKGDCSHLQALKMVAPAR